MTMAEDGDLGPNELFYNGVMNDLKDSKEYGLCGVWAVAMMAFVAAFIWLLVQAL